MQAGISFAPHIRIAVVAGVLGAALLGWLFQQRAKNQAASKALANTAALNERSLAAQKQVRPRTLEKSASSTCTLQILVSLWLPASHTAVVMASSHVCKEVVNNRLC